MTDKGQSNESGKVPKKAEHSSIDNFVLEKHIFSNIFEKDIRRVYIYKKAERLARAVHVVGPAFANSPSLRNRADAIAIGLVDAAVLPPLPAREALSRELLALSSMLSIARTSGMLSAMNADLISKEARHLLQEIAGYEEPRLFLEDAPSLAELAKALPAATASPAHDSAHAARPRPAANRRPAVPAGDKGHKGHSAENGASERRDSILSILSERGPSYIKDISTIIRNVSEKTIQRELASLVGEGKVLKEGERRWTRYSAA